MSVVVIDKGWIRIQKDLKELKGSYVKVGYPEEKSKGHKKASMDVSGLAAIHEYGTTHIPPRPFMATTLDANAREIQEFVKRDYASILDGKMTTPKSLQRLGVFFKGKIQQTFTKGSFAALKPQTIKRKKSSRPLIDTGQLRQSVDFEVVLKGGK